MDAMDAGASSRNLGLFIKLNAVYRVGHNEFRMSKRIPGKNRTFPKRVYVKDNILDGISKELCLEGGARGKDATVRNPRIDARKVDVVSGRSGTEQQVAETATTCKESLISVLRCVLPSLQQVAILTVF